MTGRYTPKYLADAARETLHAFRERDQRAVWLVVQLQLRFGTDQGGVIHALQQLAQVVPESQEEPIS